MFHQRPTIDIQQKLENVLTRKYTTVSPPPTKSTEFHDSDSPAGAASGWPHHGAPAGRFHRVKSSATDSAPAPELRRAAAAGRPWSLGVKRHESDSPGDREGAGSESKSRARLCAASSRVRVGFELKFSFRNGNPAGPALSTGDRDPGWETGPSKSVARTSRLKKLLGPGLWNPGATGAGP